MLLDYDTDVFLRPGLTLPNSEQRISLQADLCALGRVCLDPLPRYQVFDLTSPTALDDKIIVTIRQGHKLIGFVSGVFIVIDGLETPVLHTGITVIHPKHRKTSMKRLLFSNLFMTALSEYPQGIWVTSLAEVITSLVQFANYITEAFPAPQWIRETDTSCPSSVHEMIAGQISSKHRSKMCISPTATFDEKTFVFSGSNDWTEGKAFLKDVDDPEMLHRDAEASQFFRQLLRKGSGDEVLQVGFLNLRKILASMENEGYAAIEGNIISKVSTIKFSHHKYN
ncbi:membrane protein [Rutstroemia sp. NJR-2017a BVV2]|nr:membrane protein [Rutstroemia sp. NJR-2017a BVV2]